VNKLPTLVTATIVLIFLTACGNKPETSLVPGDVSPETLELGRVVFQANCSSCHSATKDAVLVGPSMVGIAARAGTRVKGLDAYDYLKESILEPDAFVNKDFPNVMPQTFGNALSDEQLEAVIQYLLHLE
jgi:mono/diheme cytochrome c family protein